MAPSHVSSFTTADTCDSFGFFYRELGENCRSLKNFFLIGTAIVGSTILARLTYNAIRFYAIYCRQIRPVRDYRKSFGKWAVIFGASEDLGLEFACHFAERGMNIIVIDDKEVPLRIMVRLIARKYKVVCKSVWLYPLSPPALELFEKIMVTAVAGKDIGVVVNNWSPGRPEETNSRMFGSDAVKLKYMIALNEFLTLFMVIKQKGAVITVTYNEADDDTSSYSSEIKAVHAYAARQQLMVRGKNGLTVQLFTPFRSAIFMSNVRAPMGYFTIVPNCTSYVKHCMEILGTARATSGFWSHSLFDGVFNMTPRWVRPSIHRCIRKLVYRNSEQPAGIE